MTTHAEALRQALDAQKAARDARDAMPHGTDRSAMNLALDRLDVAISTLAQQPGAVVYPPDGTVSPFTVINLGAGRVRMGDSIHDGRLPALWFGTNGQGMGHEEVMNREAREGETLAVVTFANVEGLDVLLEVIQRIRRLSFPAAQPAERTFTRAQLLEAIEAERNACSIVVWMTLQDALEEGADDKGLDGWMREAEARVKNRHACYREDAAAQGQQPAPPAVRQPQRCEDCGDLVPKRECWCQEGCVHAVGYGPASTTETMKG